MPALLRAPQPRDQPSPSTSKADHVPPCPRPSFAEVVIAVPALYLIPAQAYVKANAKASSAKIELAAQNVYSEEKGAFTGEISPHMLVDASINWTLVGHSERRTLFKDTSDLVAKKTASALAQGLKVVLCIGETLDERESDKTMSVCEEMTAAVIAAVKEEDWKNIVIAYEPGASPARSDGRPLVTSLTPAPLVRSSPSVWAIGTGKVATSQQAQDVHAELRKFVAKKVSQKVADEVRII